MVAVDCSLAERTVKLALFLITGILGLLNFQAKNAIGRCFFAVPWKRFDLLDGYTRITCKALVYRTFECSLLRDRPDPKGLCSSAQRIRSY